MNACNHIIIILITIDKNLINYTLRTRPDINDVKIECKYWIADEYVGPTKLTLINATYVSQNKQKTNYENTQFAFLIHRFYSMNVIELSVFLMQLIDTCKEGDGVRSSINKKRLLLYFKSGSLNNYSVEMFTSIARPANPTVVENVSFILKSREIG